VLGGPGARVCLGFFLRFPDDNHSAVRLAAVAACPCDPVRTPCFTVNLKGACACIFGHHRPEIYHLHCVSLNHPIESSFWRVSYVTLTCPNCGNDRNFLVKTLQMHVVHLEDGNRVEVSEESRPAVLEVLCDECESALNFEEFEDTLRKEVLLTIGAR
jgi:hypothetical protein